jgi:hypothetical protein
MARQTRKLHRIPRNSATMPALNHWYKSLAEKLGWIILSQAKGLEYKVTAYKKSIDHFLRSAKHVSTEYENHNRKHDINVMILNIEVLRDFVNKKL